MATKEVLERAKRADQARARLTRQMDGKVAETGRLARRVDMQAVMNAVDSEGPEVLTAKADGYWRDMDRMYPWIAARRQGPEASANGRRNRYGRVSVKLAFRGGRLVETDMR